jgi:hypothetical protein
MAEIKHTPGPWHIDPAFPSEVQTDKDLTISSCWHKHASGAEIVVVGVLECSLEESAANARLIAAAPDLLEALRLHKAWSDSEDRGPDYGGQSRDTHPDGEAIWSRWWHYNLDLCARAQAATDAAIAKAGQT